MEESAQLVKTWLERRHLAGEQADESPACKAATVNWVSSEDFSADVGLNQIREYIQTWEMHGGWQHSLIFLSSTEEQHTFYHYQVRFHTTTAQRPIQGTACVYFVAVVSKVDPRLPVEVYFVVESNRLVHTPGRTRFREKWLVDVIESKALLLREMDLWLTL